ncbi:MULTISPECIES: GPR1/FUN34/YaaH family transporter [unclassified Streptomyces]|uniref:GPR1/FUN34/YaaH family transporter n=1 Tax=unclassified Streptomyces TaxID=2593676 RepID=UPI00224F67A2|nr:GPR1/FUN34/YaaH family transporter [Streptomyces sp. NBC_01214]MCX4807951.1 GPR1/FUN34/YaaH family transporter [Streptomyces sp. NBC_01214]
MSTVPGNTAAGAPDGAPPGRRHEPDLRAMTRINLHPIASPMPLGFFTVAIASVMTGCLQLGVFEAADRRAVALCVLPAFALQLLVSFLAFGARDVIAATLMGTFAGSWLAYALVTGTGAAGGHRVLGVFNLALLCFGALMALVTRPKRALWLVIVVSLPRWAATGLAGLTGAEWPGQLAGALGLLVALVATYAAFALMLEDMRGEQVLPIGRSGPAHTAVEGDLVVQLRNLERQAGVRRTL